MSATLRSSSTCHTGFNTAGGFHTTWLTPSAASQSANASNPEVKVG
jgi:hypothetical protein